MMEFLGSGGRHLFLRRQVELSPGGEGDGGGLRRVTMKARTERTMNE